MNQAANCDSTNIIDTFGVDTKQIDSIIKSLMCLKKEIDSSNELVTEVLKHNDSMFKESLRPCFGCMNQPKSVETLGIIEKSVDLKKLYIKTYVKEVNGLAEFLGIKPSNKPNQHLSYKDPSGFAEARVEHFCSVIWSVKVGKGNACFGFSAEEAARKALDKERI